MDNFAFITAPADFFAVKTAIKSKGYSVKGSGLQYLANSKVSLGENDMELASILYQKLDEDPDVVKIYDNIE